MEHADEEHAAEEESPQVWDAESPNELGEEEEVVWSGQGDEDEDDGGREKVMTHETRSFQFHGAPWHSHKKQKRH